jgi:hypothetical protein
MAIFKISDFKTKIGQVLKPNLFVANISGPSGIGTIPNFEFRCEKAEFPGKTLATVDDPGGGGPTLKLPYDVTYNDIVLSIICSADLAERKYFEGWIDLIIGKASRTSKKAGLVNYHSVYARGKILTVNQLDEAGATKGTWTMQDIYPIAITPMNAVWDELNTYQRFEVTLTYRYYEIS